MAKRTYTESVDLILAKVDESSDRWEEAVRLLRQLNGYVRGHGELLAAHDQWMESHEKAHTALGKQMDHISLKANLIGGGSSLLALIAAALGISPRN